MASKAHHTACITSAQPGTPARLRRAAGARKSPSLAIAYTARAPDRISPFAHPKVEIMTISAAAVTPTGPHTTAIAAVATRSSLAYAIPRPTRVEAFGLPTD